MPASSKRTAASTNDAESAQRVKFSRRSDGQRSQQVDKHSAREAESDEEPSDSGSEDKPDEESETAIKILSFHYYQQQVGAAFYDSTTSTLSFLEDTPDSSMFDVSTALMEQMAPTHIITGNSSNERLIEAIIAYCEEHDECQYHIRPPKEYTLGSALSRLSGLRITRNKGSGQQGSVGSQIASANESNVWEADGQTWNMDDERQRKLTMLRLGCFTSLEARLSLCAAGGLLLQLEKVGTSRKSADLVTIMRNIEAIKLSQYMLINADALVSLSIFGAHDQSSGWSSQGEGLSLFTQIGRSLRRMKMTLANILKRIDNLSPNDWAVWKGLVDYSFTAVLVRDGVGELQAWKGGPVCTKVRALQFRRDCKIEADPERVILQAMASIDRGAFQSLAEGLVQVIDFDASRTENRVCIHSGVDDTIDELTEYIQGKPLASEVRLLFLFTNTGNKGLGTTLSVAATEVLSDISSPSLRNQLADLSTHLMPQLGYLIRVPAGEVTVRVPEDWDLRFHDDDGNRYYKETKMRQLDETLGDLLGQYSDRVVDILADLAACVRDLEPALLAAEEVVAELDCTLALAQTSQTFGLTRPRMVADNVLWIKGGRHMLYEMANEIYVGNDTELGKMRRLSEDGSELSDTNVENLMIITGANGSGKSAYGKQVGLIAYMAQIGCYVPAQEAVLSPVDKNKGINSKGVQTLAAKLFDDVARRNGTFVAHTRRVRERWDSLVARLARQPLTVPTGTLAQDGAGLLIGTLTEFLNRGVACPKICGKSTDGQPKLLTCTFYCSEIFQTHVAGVNFSPFAWQMKTHFQIREEGDDGISFLFQLERPKALSDLRSHAAECALYHGVPAALVNRAKEVTEFFTKQDIGKIVEGIAISPSEALELRQAEALTRAFLKWDLSEHGVETGRTMDALREMLEQASRIENGDNAE
ncbi:hypothetical protein NliqN6_3982 [Naganishia liquefaciens]|uniref:DNA mismatch repair proteins mutS family domain-containing protein n=1 Tax=Naganishia liquefaciens TaxID=104408 RepID=A0A8H3YFC7_9TREE|nr:hypothetical protein NliqN6_3982 [Naganishia liquefaciens]